MSVRFGEDGGFKALLGQLLQAAGQPMLGDVIIRTPGETLHAPPRGTMWHQPATRECQYQLHDLVHHPIFREGDIFGIHPRDPVPLAPSGMQLMPLHNPPVEGVTCARVFKIVPNAMAAVLALPKPPPPVLQTHAVRELPRPEPGRRWQVLGADGRNLNQMVGAMVAA